MTVNIDELQPTVLEERPVRLALLEVIREVMRAALALIFSLILFLTIWWGFSNVTEAQTVWDNTSAFLELLLPAETALLGSAVGFYFGTSTRSQ